MKGQGHVSGLATAPAAALPGEYLAIAALRVRPINNPPL